MSRWWQIATGSWWTSPSRTLAIILSVALGVGVIVTITSFYETARKALDEQVIQRWLGTAHVTIHPPGAHWGSIDAFLTEPLRSLSNVDHVTARLRRRMRLNPSVETETATATGQWIVDAIGINADTETPFRSWPNLRGRQLGATDRGMMLVERAMAESCNLNPNDTVTLSRDGVEQVKTFTIIGIFDSVRVAEFQQAIVYLPLLDLQELTSEQGVVSVIDIMLSDASPTAMENAKTEAQGIIAGRKYAYPLRVDTAAARQQVLQQADQITKMLLMLVAFVAMLTSFFIILTTQNVSLSLRRPQLGILRCLGMTRLQLVGLLCVELVPLGLVGIVLGVLGGLAVTFGVGHFASAYVTQVYISGWGITVGTGCGLATTLLSVAVLAKMIAGVTPLEAVATQAKPVRRRWAYLCGLGGAMLIVLHIWMVNEPDREKWLTPVFAGAGTMALYFGYAMLTPLLVVVGGCPIVRIVGRCLGLQAKLADEPFARSPWRSTGACWVLMVGLSLIIHLAIRGELARTIWDFPARLPGAFVWSPIPVSGDTIEEVKRIPGVGESTVTTDITCKIEKTDQKPKSLKDSLIEKFLKKLTRPVFVAGDPEKLLSMLKLAFIEGTQADTLEKVKRGGYVIIPVQTARSKGLKLGDRVTVTIRGRSAVFEIAAVVQSPALDLAVTAFQAESYMQFAAASAVLGTRDDLKEFFGLDVVSMFMCNTDLSPADPPPDFDPEHWPHPTDTINIVTAMLRWAPSLVDQADTFERIGADLRTWIETGATTPLPQASQVEVRRFSQALAFLRAETSDPNRSADEAWRSFRERLVLLRIAQVMNRPEAIIGSLQKLKGQIEDSLDQATAFVTWLPSVLLVVAAIGIGNLMQVSVHIRSRQIAMLRAVGAVKSQIIRMVLAEAITIGLLGSVIGISLGIHMSYSVFVIAERLLDVVLPFSVPAGTVLVAVALTVFVCLVSGLGPARSAARSNIIAALQAS